MKAYTSLEQSQMLAEILPLESADMFWLVLGNTPRVHVLTEPLSNYSQWESYPCWSLSALLDYLKSKNKFPEIKELGDGRFKLTTYIWDGKDCIQVSIGDSIVDACYEIIIRLHELNLL